MIDLFSQTLLSISVREWFSGCDNKRWESDRTCCYLPVVVSTTAFSLHSLQENKNKNLRCLSVMPSSLEHSDNSIEKSQSNDSADTAAASSSPIALNNLDVLSADVQNAYLNAPTKEKLFTTAGLECGSENVGKRVLIILALYRLRSSGAW